jgi:hypothetical protein
MSLLISCNNILRSAVVLRISSNNITRFVFKVFNCVYSIIIYHPCIMFENRIVIFFTKLIYLKTKFSKPHSIITNVG